MSGQSKGQVVNIPVNREPRSFEKQRRDLLTNLESRSSSGSHPGKSLTQYHEDWSNTVNKWVTSTWKKWDEDMSRLRKGMFELLPADHFTHSTNQDKSIVTHKVEDHGRDRMSSKDALSTGSVSDFLKDVYEIGEDGKVYFKVRFNAKGFDPEDINVTSNNNRLVVHAKKETKSDGGKSTHEFCRTIQLPQSVEVNQLKCRQTNDGVLILEAPVKVPEHQSLTLNESGQIGIRPKSSVQLQTVPSSKVLTVKGTKGSTVLDDGSGGKRLHIEVPVDSTYKPEDLCVTVDSNRVVVKGRHQKEQSDAHGKSGSFTEFTQSYTVSEMVDPLSVSAQLIGNTLVLEAPLVKHNGITH
ncbi:unnamed protein product [Trichobilharzia szidati]|nr:unnamed protein product [Trichobilharzia szidati]